MAREELIRVSDGARAGSKAKLNKTRGMDWLRGEEYIDGVRKGQAKKTNAGVDVVDFGERDSVKGGLTGLAGRSFGVRCVV